MFLTDVKDEKRPRPRCALALMPLWRRAAGGLDDLGLIGIIAPRMIERAVSLSRNPA
jgi:hypothetical protein